ncbi:DNA-directed RNA polymerase II subunit GRINL1A [Larimichthys crocea]|uniref:DNA-directed RNA polymerase II subunit GRINL1A n=1 Tax=Larimichthys crocea TaxID=215358 RepID=A0A6G0J0D8_LARCR|nr:DNA-directed RNA polymerase II subunit GRINL1A [Larimichthys crocea]
MLRYGSGRTVSTTTTTTTTTEDSPESLSERRIRRLRLTLHAGDNENKEPKSANSDTAEKEKDVNRAWKKKNGLIQRERPAGRESPQQHLGDMTNGVPETSLQHHGPKVYGVVQRTGSDKQPEVMAREWTANHLQDEMRDSLEKVRERMYGQFGGMQQSMQKLSQEIRAANSQRKSLESEVKVRTTAMENFDQMNSSLISANLSLQKSLIENCQNRAENQTLRLQVESSREANTQALHELSAKLKQEYEEKLQEEQRKHREEIENLQAQLDEYIRRLEEAEKTIKIAEAKIAERDQRIIEVERLLDCMGKEKGQLQNKLQECEQRLRLLELTDTTDATVVKKSKELQSETVDLRERIKHLNDMVFCQQRKVKGMIEEVESLRAQVAHKDMFISELLDRIAIVECENNELEDKLKYFMSTQNRSREVLETREIGVGCDLLPRHEADRQGQVRHLGQQSREELQELLLRQEKILSNKRLVQTLPDKGKKIKEFAEKVRLAIEHRDEEERRQSLVSAARTELQSKYQQAFTMQQRAVPNMPAASHQNRKSEAAADDAMQEREISPASADVQENNTLDEQQDQFVSGTAAGEAMETAAAGASLNSDETKEGDLVEALERVRLSETSTGFTSKSKDPLHSTARDNYFLRNQIPKKPHYMTVFEKNENTSAPRKQKFKPNQLPNRSDISPSGSSSPSQSSEGSSPLSAQARRERDRKHLDDITAAKLPPLHHSPAQLISLDESAALMKEQTKKQLELQAKLAAQKLSEGLKISMGSYTPDGGPMAAYREVHDEGAQLSSEED